MTISSQTRKAGPYIGDGTTASFPFAFKVFQASDLYLVKLNSSTNVETVLALTTDYTVSLNANQNANPGGTITLVAGALATGYKLTITSNIAPLQQTDLTNAGGFYPAVITNALDKLTILVQQIIDSAGRSLRFPVSDTSYNATLPTADQRKGAVLAFDETTGDPVVGPDIASVDTVAGNVAAINTVAGIAAEVAIAADNVADITNFADVYQGPKTVDPTLRNDGSALNPGDLYFNTTLSIMRVYSGSAWGDVAFGVSLPYQTFSGNGSQTDFALSSMPGSLGSLEVYISGVRQVPTTDYTLSGLTLTFTSAPPAGPNNIFARWVTTQAVNVPADGSVTAAKMAAGAAVGNIGYTPANKAGEQFTGLVKFAVGANIASATTVDLSAATGNAFHITGTTPISAFTMSPGEIVDVIFDGVLDLIHHATTNNLNNAGNNITTEAGDRARYFYDGTTVYCLSFTRKNGTALAGARMTLTASVATTSGTAIDFANIPSWAKRVTVLFSGVSTSGTSNPLLQIGDSGGVSNSGYTSTVHHGPNSGVSSTAGLIVDASVSAASARSGTVTLENVAGNTWVSKGSLNSSAGFVETSAGSKTLTGVFDRVRLTTTNGTDTFDAGSVSLLIEG